VEARLMPAMSSREMAEDPRLMAVLDLMRRAGARSVQLRYDEEQDPVVWVAVAEFLRGYGCGAGLSPGAAAMALADSTVDGGLCAHCGHPSGVTDDWREDMPLANVVCWYVFDPELAKFRRSCEGETTGRAYGMDPRTGKAVGRNDKCPCGSGRKWKHCHGAS
jgi:hypothetical protein